MEDESIEEDIYLSADEIDALVESFKICKKFTSKMAKIDRKILTSDKNSECPVSFELIASGEGYYICTTCNYNISAVVVYKIREKLFNDIISCPICRSTWDLNVKPIYLNL